MTGIIGAMDQEVSKLIADMEDAKKETRASMDFYSGRLCGCDVVVVKCGVGKVNAAVCTQILSDIYKVDRVINTGVAGGLKKEIKPCDVVISTDVVQHDMDATQLGHYKAGEIPLMGGKISFAADDKMRQLAVKICREVNPEISVFEGRVATGDQFIAGSDVKQRITDTFDASCAEMEGGAIAQTAWLNGIPFVIIRAISDNADEDVSMDYSKFEPIAIENSVRLVEGMLKAGF